MKAELLQKVTFYPKIGEKAIGIVIEKKQIKRFRGIELLGKEFIEVYLVHADKGCFEVSFLELEKVQDVSVEELLTHNSSDIRTLGLAQKNHPEQLNQRLQEEEEKHTTQSLKEFIASYARKH